MEDGPLPKQVSNEKKRYRTTCPSTNNSLDLGRPGGIKNAYHRGRQAKDREIPTAEQTPGRFKGSNVAAIDGITRNLSYVRILSPPHPRTAGTRHDDLFPQTSFSIGSTTAPASANGRKILTNVSWLLHARSEDMTKIYLCIFLFLVVA